MKMNRVWAMPNSNTFQVKPIGDLVKHYLRGANVSIDPFARDSRLCTYTNDLNPNTRAEHHMPAREYLKMLVDKEVKADVIIFDPPYSLGQIKECYESIGICEFTQEDAQNTWREEKALCNELLNIGGHFLHFGWHSNGIGKKHKAEIVELLLVALLYFVV